MPTYKCTVLTVVASSFLRRGVKWVLHNKLWDIKAIQALGQDRPSLALENLIIIYIWTCSQQEISSKGKLVDNMALDVALRCIARS